MTTKIPATKSNMASESQPSPRDFVINTGYVFQLVGFVFGLGACCFWSFSGRAMEQTTSPAAQWSDFLIGEHASAAILTLGVVTTMIGGAGLVALSVGLQGEKPGSGKAAVVLSTLLTAIYAALLILSFLNESSWSSRITMGAFALITATLVPLAIRSASILREFPPPDDLHVVTDDYIDPLSKNR